MTPCKPVTWILCTKIEKELTEGHTMDEILCDAMSIFIWFCSIYSHNMGLFFHCTILNIPQTGYTKSVKETGQRCKEMKKIRECLIAIKNHLIASEEHACRIMGWSEAWAVTRGLFPPPSLSYLPSSSVRSSRGWEGPSKDRRDTPAAPGGRTRGRWWRRSGARCACPRADPRRTPPWPMPYLTFPHLVLLVQILAYLFLGIGEKLRTNRKNETCNNPKHPLRCLRIAVACEGGGDGTLLTFTLDQALSTRPWPFLILARAIPYSPRPWPWPSPPGRGL